MIVPPAAMQRLHVRVSLVAQGTLLSTRAAVYSAQEMQLPVIPALVAKQQPHVTASRVQEKLP